MELFLFRHSEYEALYNCSGLQIDSIPFQRRTYPLWSILSILLASIYYALYIPCMLSIWRNIPSNHYYALLFYIGAMDLGILWILGFLHSWLSLTGSVFCSHPTLIYLTGDLASSIWRGESAGDLLLAINRCLDIVFPGAAEFLFAGRRTAFWLFLCLVYFFYWVFFEKPVAFNGLYFEWFFDPFFGYRDDPEGKFLVPMHSIHNYLMAIAFPLVYGLFLVAIYFKIRIFKKGTGPNGEIGQIRMSSGEKMTFLQVLLISMLNTIPASIHIFMQLKGIQSEWLIIFGYYLWLHLHGFPPIIYLALNKTIREDCKMFLCNKIFRRQQITHLNGVTVVRQMNTTELIQ